METKNFDGQQEGERILFTIKPHPLAERIHMVTIVLLSLFFFMIFTFISSVLPEAGNALTMTGGLVSIVFAVIAIVWTKINHDRSVTYITDRRIMRFEAISPFFVAKRALFWNEALKAKAYSPNLFWRFLNIGTLVVETQVPEQGNVEVHHVYFFEDLGNYIDKILFLFKNSPGEISSLKPFVPMPKGKRYNTAENPQQH